MFVPHNFAVALLMMITSAVCWGSWANTYKGVKNYRFELFYWDYAVGIFFISLVLAFTLGSTPHDSSSFLNNASGADGSNIISTLIGGAVFNLANLLLVAGIDMAGLAIAFPVSIGIALVVGVVASYILQPKGDAGVLAAGVTCALIAVVLDGKAYGSLANVNRSVSKKSIVTCIVSGFLMGNWAPFVTRAMTQGRTLGPYSISVFFTLGALLSGLQSCSSELHGGSYLLRDWPVRADGRRLVGRLRLEGIPGRQPPGQDISCLDVSLLSFCHSPRVSRQYRELTGALEINSMDAMPKILR